VYGAAVPDHAAIARAQLVHDLDREAVAAHDAKVNDGSSRPSANRRVTNG
jgi:hypothetical protein